MDDIEDRDNIPPNVKNIMSKRVRHIDNVIKNRIVAGRTIRGFSQVALAEILKIDPKQLSKYETGINRISASRLYEISKILGIPIEYFFKE